MEKRVELLGYGVTLKALGIETQGLKKVIFDNIIDYEQSPFFLVCRTKLGRMHTRVTEGTRRGRHGKRETTRTASENKNLISRM